MKRVLVVEDDPDLLFLYQTALSQGGYDPVLVDTVPQAIVELDAEPFDFVILDLNMPEVHGTAVIEHAMQDDRFADLPIIVVTANDHWVDEVVRSRATQVLIKPVGMAQVVALLRSLAV